MVSFNRLEASGMSRSFLRIADEGDQPFAYFTFVDAQISQRSYWELVGVRYMHEQADRVELRLLHIEEEALDWPEFIAQHDAPGYIGLSTAEMTALLGFLRDVLAHLPATMQLRLGSLPKQFEAVTAADLQAIHVPVAVIDFLQLIGRTYRLTSQFPRHPNDGIRIVMLPTWTGRAGTSQRASLGFFAFESDRLADPAFNPLDTPGLGTMIFDHAELHELIELLTERFLAPPS